MVNKKHVTPKRTRKEKSILDELKQYAEQKAEQKAAKLESQKNTSRSYLEKSYLDESESIDHFADQRLSSVQKARRQLLDYQLRSEMSDDESKGIFRSNSELYLKNIDM